MLTILNFDMLTFTAESFLKAMFAHPYYYPYYTIAITIIMTKSYGRMLEDE